jgi:hypothetical protein
VKKMPKNTKSLIGGYITRMDSTEFIHVNDSNLVDIEWPASGNKSTNYALTDALIMKVRVPASEFPGVSKRVMVAHFLDCQAVYCLVQGTVVIAYEFDNGEVVLSALKHGEVDPIPSGVSRCVITEGDATFMITIFSTKPNVTLVRGGKSLTENHHLVG